MKTKIKIHCEIVKTLDENEVKKNCERTKNWKEKWKRNVKRKKKETWWKVQIFEKERKKRVENKVKMKT